MEDKPKAAGRGLKLLEKLKARAPGPSGDASTPEPTSQDVPKSEASSSPSDVSTEAQATTKKTFGRGSLLAKLGAQFKTSEETSSPVGLSSASTIPELPKRGRGEFIKQLAVHSKLKESSGDSSVPSTKMGSSVVIDPSTVSEKSESSLFKKLEEMSLEGEKSPCIKRGELGQKINISTNYVTLMVDPGKGVFEFDVRFVPDIDYVAFRYKLIHHNFPTKKGIKCYDGGDKLYMPEKLSADTVMVEAKHPNDDSDVKIIVTFKRQLRPRECSQLYNILLNNCSKALNLTRLGRQHFDYRLGHQIPQHKLEVWPGYVTAVEEFEGGIHLCCDIRHRVLRTETAYDVIANITKYDAHNFRNSALKELLGQCVLTRYNNNLYRVDDIDWEKNPMSSFKLSSGEEITFLEYYKKQYNLNITDVKQPLLINRAKGKRSDGSVQLICLIPELCNLTGLTDKMRKDMKVMKEIATYTRVTPLQRQLGFQKFLENLVNNSRAQELLRDWGLKIATEPLKTEARILPREDIIFKDKTRLPTTPSVDWSKYLRNQGVYRSVNIRHWLLLHTFRDSNLANSFWTMLQKVGPGLGIDICDPILVPLKDDRIESYIRGLKENIKPATQIVVCLCPTSRDDRYSAIKKLCCRDIPIPSQVVNCGTISRENRMRSVVQNVALQMNNKLGGASWAIHLPLKNTMICGIDSYHDRDRRGNSVGAFVASINSDFTRWYSQTYIQEPKQELLDGLVFCFISALKKYLLENDVLPERIVIFRDGVGDGQLSVVQNHEIGQFLEACELVSKLYQPKFSFIVVQKRINTKFYLQQGNSNGVENPSSGSVLDHTVTRRNYYDFFLVSQFVTCGTATPSHYIVLYDTSELKPDLMQRLTYKFCHMYYNWPGTIRVPAPCQYAHKLAYLVGQSIKALPNEVLDDKLFYL